MRIIMCIYLRQKTLFTPKSLFYANKRFLPQKACFTPTMFFNATNISSRDVLVEILVEFLVEIFYAKNVRKTIFTPKLFKLTSDASLPLNCHVLRFFAKLLEKNTVKPGNNNCYVFLSVLRKNGVCTVNPTRIYGSKSTMS